MIRVFKLVGAQVAILMLWLRYAGDSPPLMEDLFNDLQGRRESMTPEHQALYDRVQEINREEQGRDPIPIFDEILDPLLLAVTAEPPPDISLIDKITDYLKVPFGSNFLQTSSVRLLRRALLSTVDYEALNAKLDKIQLQCGVCAHKFINGEGAYFSAGREGTPTLNCFRCAPPVYVACSSCEEGISAVSANIRQSLQAKSTCEECRIKKAEAAREAARAAAQAGRLGINLGPDPRVAEPMLGRQMWEFVQNGPIDFAPFPDDPGPRENR